VISAGLSRPLYCGCDIARDRIDVGSAEKIMSDLADQKRVAAAQGENTGTRPGASAELLDGDAAGSRFRHFAERVLPTLKQLRSARRVAEALIGDGASPALARIGASALESIRSIDATLRMTGVYDLSDLAALEGDAARMNAVCRVLDEVAERLQVLAREVTQQTTQVGDADATARLTALLSVLKAPAKIAVGAADSA
jgi:hypothetical protein